MKIFDNILARPQSYKPFSMSSSNENEALLAHKCKNVNNY